MTDPVTGFLYMNPALQRNAAGCATITASCPGVNPHSPLLVIPAIDTNQSLCLDITGATRTLNNTNTYDIGCNQIDSSGTPFNTPLTVSMVGPSYLH